MPLSTTTSTAPKSGNCHICNGTGHIGGGRRQEFPCPACQEPNDELNNRLQAVPTVPAVPVAKADGAGECVPTVREAGGEAAGAGEAGGAGMEDEEADAANHHLKVPAKSPFQTENDTERSPGP